MALTCKDLLYITAADCLDITPNKDHTHTSVFGVFVWSLSRMMGPYNLVC